MSTATFKCSCAPIRATKVGTLSEPPTGVIVQSVLRPTLLPFLKQGGYGLDVQ